MQPLIELKTRNVETCHLCGAHGNLYRQGMQDPDHQIAGEWQYQLCTNAQCGSVWLSPRPLDEELLKAYASYHCHTKPRQSFLQKSLPSLARRLTRLTLFPLRWALGLKKQAAQMRFMGLGTQQPGSLLELGVGGGRFLLRMKKRGWDVSGVDYDPNATKRIYDKYRIKVHTGDLLQLDFTPNSFDVIAMNQTVEHLTDPGAVFAKCRALLKPGGRLVVTTPNIESSAASLFGKYWRGWEPPRHLHLYSLQSMQALATHAGLAVERLETYTCESAIGYHASYMISAFHRAEQPTALRSAGIVAWSYWMELKETFLNRKAPSSGQGIFLVARKPV